MVPAVTHSETKGRYREVTPGGRDVPANISHPVGRLGEASNPGWAEKLEGECEDIRSPGCNGAALHSGKDAAPEAPSTARSSVTNSTLPLGLGSALLDWASPSGRGSALWG